MKEKQFWNRILEFAQERLTRSMYDFYAIQAELIKVEENVATIFLPRSEMEMVWEKQLKDIIVVAGFEIYDAEITPHYIFTKPQDTTISQVEEATNSTLYDYSPKLASIPDVYKRQKQQFHLCSFVNVSVQISSASKQSLSPFVLYENSLQRKSKVKR